MSESSSSEQGPRRRGLLWAGVFVGAVVVALIIVLLGTRGGNGHDAGPPAAQSPSNSPRPSASGYSSVAPVDQTVPTSPPPGVHWDLFHGVALPTSSAAGPSHSDEAMASGFAHSPTGALIASQQIETRAFLAPGAGWRKVARAQFVPAPARAKYVRAESQATSSPSPGSLGQTAGFKFVTYTPDTAVIEIASRFPSSGQLQVTTSTMRWLDGDWKQELQPDGSPSPTAQALSDLVGFVEWSGV